MADSMSDSIRLTMSEKYTFQTWLTRASQPCLTLIADAGVRRVADCSAFPALGVTHKCCQMSI